MKQKNNCKCLFCGKEYYLPDTEEYQDYWDVERFACKECLDKEVMLASNHDYQQGFLRAVELKDKHHKQLMEKLEKEIEKLKRKLRWVDYRLGQSQSFFEKGRKELQRLIKRVK